MPTQFAVPPRKPFGDPSGRVAVITGGASGIGRAIAVACCDAGMRVVLADVDAAALDAAAAELGVAGISADVCDPASVEALAAAVFDRFGACDLLVNNAGIGGVGRIDEQRPADWDRIIDVNLRGVAYVVHAFLPRMLAADRGGHIVNTASIAGLIPLVNGPYTTTKYAVVGLSESLRNELVGTKVGVSVLCPGFVRTNIMANTRAREPRSEDRRSPMFFSTAAPEGPLRVVDPEEIAAAVMAALAAGDFWIITDPTLLAFFGPRYDELRAIAEGALG